MLHKLYYFTLITLTIVEGGKVNNYAFRNPYALSNMLANFLKDMKSLNKRVQKALCRSPKEQFKGHSGAICRGPLMLSTKYL